MSDFSVPCSDYIETRGVIFFPRMLSKIRLSAAGRLPPGYNLGFSDSTCFDARFCRFWEVDYQSIVERTLQGGTDEEIFDETFAGRVINPEHVLVWNNFIEKRGWRDAGSSELAAEKQAHGFNGREDIQTFVDFHDADEGRKPKFA